ncbi:hypothetical protein BBJ28_00010567 [Nothophytophthora sp. Chile5]|nr:hypothetical protein BBJ28_00010567 [Nothophytophthora sp. Chile5]
MEPNGAPPPPPVAGETSVLIMGHRVAFPAGKSPFPAQLAVMSSTLAALKRRQHALVESPTGSGKTLALLCSCLTFQRQRVREVVAEQQQRQQGQAKAAAAAALASAGAPQPEPPTEWDDDALALLERSFKRFKREDGAATGSVSSPAPLAAESALLEKAPRVKPPCIFFCSRTHSQLAQVVKELKGCPASYMLSPEFPLPPFNDATLMTCVLGSKRLLCVNIMVNDVPSEVNERCQELRRRKDEQEEKEDGSIKTEPNGVKTEDKPEGCPYSQTSFSRLRQEAPTVWDIEDITALASSESECAYYFAKSTLESAHIVFCPYNYVLDPSIRAAVGIHLNDAIVVLDEAHNVEDTCRSGASLELTDSVLAAAIKSFDDVIWHGDARVPKSYNAIRRMLDEVKTWFNSNAELVREPEDPDDEECHMVWSTQDALVMLDECRLTNVTATDLEEIAQNEQRTMAFKGDDKKKLLSTTALNTAQRLVSVSSYMCHDNFKNADDFKLLITKKMQRTEEREVDTKLCIWCLSAAVAFADVARQAHSVILASGTLSPMDSFAGELGVDFPIRLEANHVVDMRKQVFVSAIMNGPRHVDLLSTYKNQQNFQYQDAMGDLLLQYAQVIPGGILMFFPSYALMTMLKDRWKRTDIWTQIQEHKTMFSEPREGGKEFDALLGEYKTTIARYTAGHDDPSGWNSNGSDATAEPRKTGAIFLAVYRGKVSEGIDFSDANARAVLAVGIPFPSFMDLHVLLKREYQDKKSRTDSKLVNGSLWYKLQAFRALNQALGRCIRHRRDYGAVVLLDSRHRSNRHAKSLSKWMRPFVQEFEYSEQCNALFAEFFQRNQVELPTATPTPPPPPVVASAPMVLEYEESVSVKRESRTVP